MNDPLWLDEDKAFTALDIDGLRRMGVEPPAIHEIAMRAHAEIDELMEALETCARKFGDHCESEYLSGTGESTYKEFTGLLRRDTPPEVK